MKISADSASVANEKISLKSGGDTPVIDHSNRAVNIKLANASVGALKISDALTDIFEISTDTWKTTGSTVKITTPTIDVTGDNTTRKVNSNSDSALSFSDGTGTMMNFATDPSLGNQKITLAAGASVGFETPMIDYSSRSTTFRLKSNVTDAWKITGLSCKNGAYHTQTACETNGSWTGNVCSDSTNSFSNACGPMGLIGYFFDFIPVVTLSANLTVEMYSKLLHPLAASTLSPESISLVRASLHSSAWGKLVQ